MNPQTYARLSRVDRHGLDLAALTTLQRFDRGDAVIVTEASGAEHVCTVISIRLADGQYGPIESYTVLASLGPGRYTFTLTVTAVASGALSVRPVRRQGRITVAASDVPPMPLGWQPELSEAGRKAWPNGLDESGARLHWLREHGYRGWIDADGYAVDAP